MNLMQFVGSIAGVLLINSISFAASDRPVEAAGLALEKEILKVQPKYEGGNPKAKKDLYGPVKFQNIQLEKENKKTALGDAKSSGSAGSESALGLNWYINPQLSVTADYVSMQYKPFVIEVDDGKGSDDLSLFQTRIQLRFY